MRGGLSENDSTTISGPRNAAECLTTAALQKSSPNQSVSPKFHGDGVTRVFPCGCSDL